MSVPTGPAGLREQLAEALRKAPVHATVMRLDVLTEVYGPVDDLADAVLAVVQPLLDAAQADAEEAHARCADWDRAHRTLLARNGQLAFGVRTAAHLLRDTADQINTGEPLDAGTLRVLACDLGRVADDKETPR